jgi:hypothetical protein
MQGSDTGPVGNGRYLSDYTYLDRYLSDVQVVEIRISMIPHARPSEHSARAANATAPPSYALLVGHSRQIIRILVWTIVAWLR